MAKAKEERDWRGINVCRNREYEHVVELLCTRKTASSGRPLFEFNKDLMVFAAMVGFTHNKKKSISKDAIQIVLGTYASDEKDGYIYLLALLESKDITILKDERLDDCIKIFESYCNGGLSIIDTWLSENPHDFEGTTTLVDQINQELSKNEDNGVDITAAQPDF